MTDKEEFNRYTFAQQILLNEMGKIGGKLMARAFANDQIEYLRENDASKANSYDLMLRMFGTGRIDEVVDQYIGLGQVIKELGEIRERKAEE